MFNCSRLIQLNKSTNGSGADWLGYELSQGRNMLETNAEKSKTKQVMHKFLDGLSVHKYISRRTVFDPNPRKFSDRFPFQIVRMQKLSRRSLHDRI